MIAVVVCFAVAAALSIRPALAHDADLPVSHTGSAPK